MTKKKLGIRQIFNEQILAYSMNKFSHFQPKYAKFTKINSLNPKMVWPSPCGFSKNVSSKERVKPWFFVTFSIIMSHIFPQNFIEIPPVIWELWRISLSIYFPDFLHFLVSKKLMASAYNNWCQQIFTFNIL